MKENYCLLLLVVTLMQSSCGDRSELSPAGGKVKQHEKLTAVIEVEAPAHPDLNEWDREYEWSPAKIKQRHRDIFLLPLPDYIQEIRGRSREDYQQMGYWGFKVPPENIAEFENYLVEIGVREEFLHQASGYLDGGTRGDWTVPDPPAEQIILVRSTVGNGFGNYLGLEFNLGDMVYHFDNPNLVSSSFTLAYSKDTGNVLVTESKIGLD